jgi:hypothetical protein
MISAVSVIMMIGSVLLYFVEKRNSRLMLVALENAFLVQFTYYSISGIGELNPLFLSMAQGLKFSAGYDIILNSN